MLDNIESPYAGNIKRNVRYARLCMKDSLSRGEYPISSHLLYTQQGILDDTNPQERELGIKAGFAWNKHAEKTIMYLDYGVSKGMVAGFQDAVKNNRPVEYRRLFPTQKNNIFLQVKSLLLYIFSII